MNTKKRHPLEFRLLWQAMGWLMVALVIITTLMPQPPKPPLVTWDKAQHLLSYGVLMFWFWLAFTARPLWISFLLALGVSLEFLQGWSAYRHFEYADMLANALGVVLGVALALTPLNTVLEKVDQQLAVWTRRQIRS